MFIRRYLLSVYVEKKFLVFSMGFLEVSLPPIRGDLFMAILKIP
jgi:hypothetical protein